MFSISVLVLSLAMTTGDSAVPEAPNCFLLGNAGPSLATLAVGCSNGGDGRSIAIGFMAGGSHGYALDLATDVEGYGSLDWSVDFAAVRGSVYLGFGGFYDGKGVHGSPRALLTTTLSMPIAPWAGLYLEYDVPGLSLGTQNSGALFAKPKLGMKAVSPSNNLILLVYFADNISNLLQPSTLLEPKISPEFAVIWLF